jgi:hypothetical protein
VAVLLDEVLETASWRGSSAVAEVSGTGRWTGSSARSPWGGGARLEVVAKKVVSPSVADISRKVALGQREQRDLPGHAALRSA